MYIVQNVKECIFFFFFYNTPEGEGILILEVCYFCTLGCGDIILI